MLVGGTPMDNSLRIDKGDWERVRKRLKMYDEAMGLKDEFLKKQRELLKTGIRPTYADMSRALGISGEQVHMIVSKIKQEKNLKH